MRSRAPAGVVLLPGLEVSSRTPCKNFIYNDNGKFLWSSCEFLPPGEISARSGASVGGIIPGYPKEALKTDKKGKNR